MVIRQVLVFLISLIGYKNWSADFRVLVTNRQIRKSVIISCLLGTGNSLLFYQGLNELPISIVSALINTLNLISATAIGVMFFKQKHNYKFYILIGLLIPATALLVVTDFKEGFNVSVFGLLCLAGSAILYTTSDHMTKGQLDVISLKGVVVFKGILSIFLLTVLAIINWESVTTTTESLTFSITALLIYSSINSFIVTILHTKSIKELGATVTTVFTSLTPVFSIVFALLLFKETLQLSQWVGVASTVALLYFITRVKQ